MPSQPSWAWTLPVLFLCISSIAALTFDILAGHTYFVIASLIPRLVAFIHAANFASVAVQARGLIGPNGILPVCRTLRDIEENLSHRDRRGLRTPASSKIMARFAVWTWRNFFGEENVVPVALCGCALAASVAVGRPPAAAGGALASSAAFALLYLYWYAYKRALGIFANLQWDMLLLESTILCVLLTAAPAPVSAAAAVHLFRACVLRLHCGAGVAKLTSGDRQWRSLTALAVHHETQPLPARLAPRLHSLPMRLHRASTFAALFLEIGTCVACLPLPYAGDAAFLMVATVQLSIVLSGNYGYFNALSAFLGLSLLHDSSPLLEWLRPRLPPVPPLPASTLASSISAAAVLAAAAPCALLYFVRAAHYAEGRCHDCFFSTRTDPWLRTASSTFFFANRFSLFSNITVPRYEIVIEGTDDGATWTEYDFRYKPGRTDAGIKEVPPLHMPRLDWRLWILAQQGRSNPRKCAVAPEWFDALLEGLVEGRPDVVALLRPSSPSVVESGPRLAVRGRRYVYGFRNSRGAPSVWVRTAPEGRGSFFGRKVAVAVG